MFRHWIELYKRRQAIRSYARVLGPLLRKRYGRSPHYTVAQVKTTAESARLNTDYLCFAYAEYCTESDFTLYHDSIGETCDYLGMRDTFESSGVGAHGEHSGGWGDFFGGSGHDSGSFGDGGHSGDGGGGGHH